MNTAEKLNAIEVLTGVVIANKGNDKFSDIANRKIIELTESLNSDIDIKYLLETFLKDFIVDFVNYKADSNNRLRTDPEFISNIVDQELKSIINTKYDNRKKE